MYQVPEMFGAGRGHDGDTQRCARAVSAASSKSTKPSGIQVNRFIPLLRGDPGVPKNLANRRASSVSYRTREQVSCRLGIDREDRTEAARSKGCRYCSLTAAPLGTPAPPAFHWRTI